MNKRTPWAWVLAAAVGGALLNGCQSVPPMHPGSAAAGPSSAAPSALAEAPVLGFEPVAKGVYVAIDRRMPLTEEGLARGKMTWKEVMAALAAKVGGGATPTTQPSTKPADERGRGAGAEGRQNAEPPPLAVKYYLQGRERFLEGANSEATDYLEKALGLDPEAFTVLRLMGRVCFASSQLARGAMYLDRAHKIQPQDVEVNYLLGRYWLERSDSERASYYLMLAQASPEKQITSTQTPLSAFYLGVALQQAGYHAAAAKAYEQFLELAQLPVPGYRYDPELSYLINLQWATHLAAAENLARIGSYPAALPHYQIAADAQPEDLFIGSRLVNALAHVGKNEAARKAAMALLSATRGSDDAINLVGWAYRSAGREGDLIGDLTVYLHNGVTGGSLTEESAALTLAATQDYLGRKSAAFATLRSYLEAHPQNLQVLERLLQRVDSPETFEQALRAAAAVISAKQELASDVLKLFVPVAQGPAGAAFLKGRGGAAAKGYTAADYYLAAITARAHDGDMAEVEKEYRRAIGLSPEFFPARSELALYLLSREQFAQATALIQEAITRNLGGARALLLQVQSEVAQQRYVHALQLAHELKAKYPDDPEARMELVAVYQLRGQDREADDELQQLLRDMPKYEPAYEALVNGLLARSRRGAAAALDANLATVVATLNKLMQEVPGSRFGRIIGSAIYARSGRLEEAETILRTMLPQSPDDPELLVPLAQIRDLEGRRTEANSTLEAALQRQAQPELVKALAALYRGQNRSAEALSLARRMMEQNGDAPEYALVYVGELIAQGKRAESAAALSAAKDRFPRSEPIALGLAEALEQENQPEAAVRVMQGLIRSAGQTTGRLYVLAHFCTAAGNDDASVAALQGVLAIMPDHIGANNDLGYFWADAGIHLDQAEPMIRKALENKPDDPAFVDSMGWLCYKQGKFADAARWLEKAVDLPGGAEPEVVQHLGDALYRLGQTNEATKRWELARQMLSPERNLTKDDQRVRDYLDKVLAAARTGKPAEISPTAQPIEPRAAGPTSGPATVPQ